MHKFYLETSSSFTSNLNLIKHLLLLLLCLPSLANAEDGLASKILFAIKTELSQTWESEYSELYIPVNTWHNRNYYSKEKIEDYNERPWGLGAGKYRYDEDGDWHGIYAFAFLDSHSDVEPIAGYGFQKVWRASDNIQLGVGYTAGLALRKDSDYVPCQC